MPDTTQTLKQGLDSSCKIIGAQLQQHGLEAAVAALEGLQNIIKADAELQIEKPGRPAAVPDTAA